MLKSIPLLVALIAILAGCEPAGETDFGQSSEIADRMWAEADANAAARIGTTADQHVDLLVGEWRGDPRRVEGSFYIEDERWGLGSDGRSWNDGTFVIGNSSEVPPQLRNTRFHVSASGRWSRNGTTISERTNHLSITPPQNSGPLVRQWAAAMERDMGNELLNRIVKSEIIDLTDGRLVTRNEEGGTDVYHRVGGTLM